MAYGELKVFAYIRVQRHHVYILNGLYVSCLVMEPHGLGTAPVESVSSFKRTVLYDGMCLQFGVFRQVPPVEITFPLHVDMVPCLCDLL